MMPKVKEEKIMILESIRSNSIPNGTKFVAFYGDGSGAMLFLIDANGHLFNAKGSDLGCDPEVELMDRHFIYWLELPRDFKLLFEQRRGQP